MPQRIIKHVEENPRLWKFIASAAALAAAGAIGFNFFSHSDKPEKKQGAITEKDLTITAKTEADLWKMVQREDLVNGVQVINVNLTKNKRSTIFFKSDDPSMQAAWDEYWAHRTQTQQTINVTAFSASEPESNDRIAKIMNGDFDCRTFKSTITYKLAPDIDHYAPWVCSISIPPGIDRSGSFNGLLTFYLNKEPSDLDKQNLVKIGVELSRDIYRRDVENFTATVTKEVAK